MAKCVLCRFIGWDSFVSSVWTWFAVLYKQSWAETHWNAGTVISLTRTVMARFIMESFDSLADKPVNARLRTTIADRTSLTGRLYQSSPSSNLSVWNRYKMLSESFARLGAAARLVTGTDDNSILRLRVDVWKYQWETVAVKREKTCFHWSSVLER